MNRLKESPTFWLSLALLLCLVITGHAIDTPDTKEAARQAARMADDNASTLEGRQAAQKKLEEAAILFLNADDTVEAARVLNRLGRMQLILNEPQAALDTHQKALDLLKQKPEPQVEVDNLNSQAEAYLRLQKRDQVVSVLQQAVSLSERSGYSRGQAQALLTLSESQNYDNHRIGIETAQKALSLWKTLDDQAGVARTYAQIGDCYQAQNLVVEATQNYEEERKIWQALNNPTRQAGALINLGFIEYRKGDWQSEISYLTQAQTLIDEKAEPAMMGRIASGLAEAFNESGLPEVGLNHYERALEYFRPTQNAHAIAYLTLSIGRTYYLLEKYPEAIGQLQQALAISEPGSTNQALSYQYLGRVYLATQQYAVGQEQLERALAIYERQVNPREAAFVRGLLGQIYDQQGQPDLARKYFQQALSSFDTLSDRINEAAIYYALGRLEMKQNNFAAAEEHLLHSIKLTDDIRRVSTSSDLAAAFSASVHERYEAYIECLMHKHLLHPEEGFAARALEASELARGRALAEMLRATQTNLAPGLEPKLAAEEKYLRQTLRSKEEYKVRLLNKPYKKEVVDALESEIKALQDSYRQVSETILARYPAYDQINRPTAWSLAQIQAEILGDDQTVLIEYSLGETKSFVWAVTRDHITSAELPSRAVINEAAERVYDLLKATPSQQTESKLAQAAQDLSRIILLPMAAELHKRRIIVVTDGALTYVPFQVLPSPKTNNALLVTEHEIVNVPSASILGQLRQETARRAPPTKVLAAFGDPIFALDNAESKGTNVGEQGAAVQTLEAERLRHSLRDIELSGDSFDPSVIKRLTYAKRELAVLREFATVGETFVAADFDATRELLQSTDLSRFAILHFATHGFLNPKRPENSGLVLSTVNRAGQTQNGFVELQDIFNLHAPVDLVVLSACQTALGKNVRGEGLIGLTRGFMYAGASSVVASLWKVDDEATAELMKQFYTNLLQKGMPPDAALRAAQDSIRQRPEWRSPYYWAAFTLQGEYSRVIKPASSSTVSRNRKMVVGLSLLVLLGAGAWMYRRHRWKRIAPSYSTSK